MRSIIYLMLTLLVCSVNITAQVTIGSDQPPRAGAGLDLRSSDKGLLLPNVSLSNPATDFQLKGGEGATAAGMVVYNTSNSLDGPGVYVWDGSRWILITCVPETPGTIDLSPTAVNLNGTFTASVPEATGPAAPTAYAWALPTGLTGTSTTRTITITGATTGTYNAGTIKVTATNACGTSAEQTSAMAVTVRDCSAAPATPTLTVTATTINRTGTTTLSCTDVSNGATAYEWTLPSGLTGSSTTNTIVITGATAGTYNANTISVKATNDCGNATATGSGGAITVRDCSTAPATPTLTVTATTINRTGTTTLSCANVNNGATTYEWTLPSGLTGSSTTRTITVTGATAGTYAANTIKVTATNACGKTTATGSGGAITVRDCSATPTVSRPASDETKITKQGVALPAALSVTADGKGATPTYRWQSSANLSTWANIGSATAAAYTAPVANAGTTYYRCVVTTGCGSATSKVFTVNVCGTAIQDGEGNWYCTGDFGDAGTWMTMNLRTKSGVPENINSNDVNSAYYYYPGKNADILTSHPEYGLLYTWAAANIGTSATDTEKFEGVASTRQGICPTGWHLPSDYEWNQLEEEIAKSAANVYSTTAATTWESGYSTTSGSYRGAHGQKMKSRTAVVNSSYDPDGTSNGLAANGFDALLVGRMGSGSEASYGTHAIFWSSSSNSSTSAWRRYPAYNSIGVYRTNSGKYLMYSVRCKKDCSAAPAISSPSSDQTPANQVAGATYTMTVTADGKGATPTYQWQSSTTGTNNWSNVSTGGNSNVYNAPTALANLGTAYYRCRVTTTCGEAVSPKWKITVINCSAAPTISSPATDETKITKQGVALPAALSVTADGKGATPTYQWQSSANLSVWANVGSATAATFTAPVNVAGTTYYRCVVNNGCGSATSKIFTVNVCGTAIQDDEGNWYCTGDFGTAGTWMTTNLRTKSSVPENINSGNANSAYYYYPDKNSDILTSHPEYGLLYTWAAASGRTGVTGNEANSSHGPHQGICPAGWHLPSDLECNQLEQVIAESAANVYSTTAATDWDAGWSTASSSYRGAHGQKMKSRTAVSSSYATNGTSNGLAANGFDALLVGYMVSGSPSNYGKYMYFWSSSSESSENNTRAWVRYLDYNATGVYRYNYHRYDMCSVRCKKN